MQPVRLPIQDVLDLHTFRPADVPDLLAEYLSECLKAGIFTVRIIHGKGHGIQKRRVRALLARNPKVKSFRDAALDSGGWGATIVELRKD